MARGSELMRGSPPGVSLIRSLRGKDWSFSSYRYAVLLITFIAYTCYHASRKPISIVKSVLYPEPETVAVSNPWPFGSVFIKELLGMTKAEQKIRVGRLLTEKMGHQNWDYFKLPVGPVWLLLLVIGLAKEREA